MRKSKEKLGMRVCSLMLATVMVLGVSMPTMAAGEGRVTHGTSKTWITEDQVNNTPPADYKVNKSTQGEAEDGKYNKYFLKDAIQEVRIDIDENNFNYLVQNAVDENYVMTNSVTIGDTTLGYAGIKCKGAYTLQHAYDDNPGSDRFSFTVNFGKYIKKAEYGETQNFYGVSKISFNNFFFDLSMLKEYTAWTILSEMGLPCPQFGLAKLYVNDQYYGVYFMIEAFDESILEQFYDTDDKNLSNYLTKPEGTNFLYDQIMEDDSALWEKDEDTYADVEEMLPTVKEWVRKLNCLSEATDFEGNKLDYNSDEYVKLLNEVLDVEMAIRYFAAHSWLVQTDSLMSGMKNFGLYVDENGKALIMPWDYDLSYGTFYPGNANQTVNYNINAIYMLGNWGDDILNAQVPANKYDKYPLFNVIFRNDELRSKYYQYMIDCSKIAALGGTTVATGKSYNPGHIATLVDGVSDELIEAAGQKLASNVYYMNMGWSRQPNAVKDALPNIKSVLLLRAIAVYKQASGENCKVNTSNCDLSTLGNGSWGDTVNNGRVALGNIQTNVFVTGDFAGSRRNQLVLLGETILPDNADYSTISSAIGATKDDSVEIYKLNMTTKAKADYEITIPLSAERMEKNGDIRIYLYNNGQVTELTPTVNDNLYTVMSPTLGTFVVMQENGNLNYDPMTVIIIAVVVAVVVIAVVVIIIVLAMKKKKKAKADKKSDVEDKMETDADKVTESEVDDEESDNSTEQ